MPFVPGESLQQRLNRQGPLDVVDVLRIGQQVAEGLSAAHEQGLVHRDIKPGNILLERNVDRVLLTDFGLARAADDASLTQSGVIAGTPQYMSPEQARGDSVDHRTDLFSLGTVLYTLLAGHSPFRAETALGVLRRVCEDTPRSLRELNPGVPAWLEAFIARLQAKSPSDRFESAAQVADLLRRSLAHVQQPTLAPLPAEVSRLARRRPDPVRVTVWSLGMVVCVAVVVWSQTSLPKLGPRTETPTPQLPGTAAAIEHSDWNDRDRHEIDAVRSSIETLETTDGMSDF
jgi:serine/threonine-protein kinase